MQIIILYIGIRDMLNNTHSILFAGIAIIPAFVSILSFYIGDWKLGIFGIILCIIFILSSRYIDKHPWYEKFDK